MKVFARFWFLIGLIWLFATISDRSWWHHYNSIPSWDQADYLNSALDHGRALGILAGGKWQGFQALLDLSPKIPPLASLINGSVIAIAGDAPKQAAWSLSIWNGLLLASTAGWGIYLRGKSLSLLSVAFIAITPALLQLRSDYVLEMPLTACLTLTLWRLGCWLDPHKGGQWWQALIAAIACTAALLIKQSALLILLPSLFVATAIVLRRNQSSKWQLICGIGLVISGVLPWLRHNWITTLGGTNRAVIESANREGDPSLLTLENWIWYPRLLPEQIGLVVLIIGLSGGLLWILMRTQPKINSRKKNDDHDNPFAWRWLIITFFASWLFTSLSPNKDGRYITPLLPPLILLLSRGWWQWGLWAKDQFQTRSNLPFAIALLLGFSAVLPTARKAHHEMFKKGKSGPLKDIVQEVANAYPNSPKKTLIVVPSTPDLNQHNVSYFGRRNGGQLVGRQLGSNKKDIGPLLSQAEWVVLAEGDQGSVRKSALLLDKAVRTSNIFTEIRRFKRENENSYSLWKRRKDVPKTNNFDKRFPQLALGLAEGPKGIETVFAEVAIQHMLDGHFTYRIPVQQEALKRLKENSNDIEARWTMSLLAILANRPSEAAKEFSHLQALIPTNPWPSAYKSLMNLACWNPWEGARVADQAHKKHNNPILKALGDLNGVLGGALWRLPSASRSIPNAFKLFSQTQ